MKLDKQEGGEDLRGSGGGDGSEEYDQNILHRKKNFNLKNCVFTDHVETLAMSLPPKQYSAGAVHAALTCIVFYKLSRGD